MLKKNIILMLLLLVLMVLIVSVIKRNIETFPIYDIRGSPNIVYIRGLNGFPIPYGYLVNNNVYDVQGQYIEHINKKHYII